MKIINDTELGDIISENKKPLVVDFYSDNCPACVAASSILAKLEASYDGKINFLAYNVSNNNIFSSKFSIMGLPSILVIKDNKVMGQVTGLITQLKVKKIIDKYV